MTHPAFVVEGNPTTDTPYVLTCEHATNLLPPPLKATPDDQHWLAQHWGWDIGIQDVTQRLREKTQSVGVFSRFSRLICDPNRAIDNPTWLLEEVEGAPLSFNTSVTEAERERRRAEYYDPYHQGVHDTIATRRNNPTPFLLLSMHSFTPLYMGEPRSLEVGVLFDENYEHLAYKMGAWIEQEGLITEYNEPYSGMGGMMYSIWRHGNHFGLPYLELEIRQDLIDTREKAHAMADRILPSLEKLYKHSFG